MLSSLLYQEGHCMTWHWKTWSYLSFMQLLTLYQYSVFFLITQGLKVTLSSMDEELPRSEERYGDNIFISNLLPEDGQHFLPLPNLQVASLWWCGMVSTWYRHYVLSLLFFFCSISNRLALAKAVGIERLMKRNKVIISVAYTRNLKTLSTFFKFDVLYRALLTLYCDLNLLLYFRNRPHLTGRWLKL